MICKQKIHRTEISGNHVKPHIDAQRLKKSEQFRFDALGFLEKNVDAQGEKRFREIDRLNFLVDDEHRDDLRFYLLALIRDGNAS